jgi:CRISPR-associated protein Cas2
MLYVVSYDIPDARRRTRVANACKDFGQRVQYSVFECLLKGDLRERLVSRLKAETNEREDSIRIYPLCAACEKGLEILGQGERPSEPEVFIV